jgi:DNA polymerase I-like protein with 3'-5' exonuclease and polymerase domains
MAYLYDELKLPIQYSHPGKGIEPKPTTDYEALLNLSKYCQKSEQSEKLKIILKLIEVAALDTRQAMLSIAADADGRIRCGYNIVGSETGRITCYTSPTGSGYNLQTIPNYTSIEEAPGKILGDRDLFLPDPGYWMFACGLEGADGWTVAAYAKMLGDPTMFDDYSAGLRPAKILTLMMRGVKGNYRDREWLKDACRAVDKSSWDYFASKRVQHGASYLEGPLTISRNILKDSEGKLWLSQTECAQLRSFFFQRYWGIQRWHQWVGRQIAQRPVLKSASGQERVFFGRPEEILTSAVAHEPQCNTTYAINLAMQRLWLDPDNRVNTQTNNMRSCTCQLRAMPLHSIHDELVGQFPKADTDWAVKKIKTWFANVLKIAGQDIIIPFEGGYGESWADAKAKVGGDVQPLVYFKPI